MAINILSLQCPSSILCLSDNQVVLVFNNCVCCSWFANTTLAKDTMMLRTSIWTNAINDTCISKTPDALVHMSAKIICFRQNTVILQLVLSHHCLYPPLTLPPRKVEINYISVFNIKKIYFSFIGSWLTFSVWWST